MMCIICVGSVPFCSSMRVSMSVLEGVSEYVVLSAFEGPACLRSYLNCSDGDSEYAELAFVA